MSTPVAYLNGRIISIDEARLHVFDLGVVGGTAVTEMVRTFRHQLFLLPEHIRRFQKSLECTGLTCPISMEELKSVCHEITATNAALISPSHDLGLIFFVTAGTNPTYVGHAGVAGHATLCVHTFPLPFELWARTFEVGVHLVTVPVTPIPRSTIDPAVKHRSRLHWHLAARQAHQVDPAATAILLDPQGHLTETASGNLCVIDGTTIVTPATEVLHGISRDFVQSLAEAQGMTFVHAPVTPENLAQADEAFLTSTPNCLLPVTKFNQRPIGTGKPGPVGNRLLQAWSQAVGVDIARQLQDGARDRITVEDHR